MKLLDRIFRLGQHKKRPSGITFDDVKSYVLDLDDHRKGVEMSELVKAAYGGKKIIHGKPYSVHPELRQKTGTLGA